MSEQTPKYSKVVEDAVETSGVDIGRIKDKELAQEVADAVNGKMLLDAQMLEDGWTDTPKTQEEYKDEADQFVKLKLAKKAVEAAAGTLIHNAAVEGVKIGMNRENSTVDRDARGLVEKARNTAYEYEQIQDQAKSADRKLADK